MNHLSYSASQGIAADSLGVVIQGTVPYYFIIVFFVILLTVYPQIAMCLPEQMHRWQVIDIAAKKMADDFFQKFSAEVSQDGGLHEAPADAPVAETTDALQRSDGAWKWWIVAGSATAIIGMAFAILR